MVKKFLIPTFCILLFIVSCKKDSTTTTQTQTTATGVEFDVSAATAMNITINISRPVTATTGTVLADVTENGIVIPYTYKYNDQPLKNGDVIDVEVTTTKNQAITGTLKINGNTSDADYEELNGTSGISVKGWHVTIIE